MAKYGYNKYGAGFKYGETTAISVYYNSQITAWATDYLTVQLNWSTVVSNPTDPYPTHWKLVKSSSGYLDDPEDGITIAGGPFSQFVTSYTDIASEQQGSEVNYSIWVFNGNGWIFCGSDYTIVVSNKDSLSNFTSWLPKAWLNPVEGVGEVLGEPGSNSLVTTLGVYAFMYDKLRSEAMLLSYVNNPQLTPNVIVNNRLIEFGFSPEPALGDSYHRSLASTGNIINSRKGTSSGISTYSKSLTHFTNKIKIGHNLMLDYNDSSFEESTGNWGVATSNAVSFSHIKYANTPTYNPPSSIATGLGIQAPLIDRVNLPRTKGYAKLVTTTTDVVKLSLPASNSEITTKGIPVKERTRYLFTGWVDQSNSGASVNARFVYVYIKWFDRFGNLISTTTDDTFTLLDGGWHEITSQSDSGRNGQISPKEAAFAGIEIDFRSPYDSYTTTYTLDFFQFAEADKSFEYEDARKIKVITEGNQVNLIPNSTFEDNIGFWDVINGELTRDNSNTAANKFGSSSAKLHSKATGLAAYVSDWFIVVPNEIITASGYLTGSQARNAKIRIEFSNKQTAELQNAVFSDEDGSYYPIETAYDDSDALTLTTSRQRMHVTTVAPPSTRDSGDTLAKVSFYIEDNQVEDTYWLDSVLVEHASEPSNYFSGNGGVFPENPAVETFYKTSDCSWGVENIYNFVSNPSFELNSTVDWTGGVTFNVASSFESGTVTPLYGVKLAQVVPGSSHQPLYSDSYSYAYYGPPTQEAICPGSYYLDGNICRSYSNPGITTSPYYYPVCPSGKVYLGGSCYTEIVTSTPYCPHTEDTLVDSGGPVCNHYGSGSITFTAYLPSPAIGGEDFVGSVYVKGAAAKYLLEDNEYIVDAANANTWVRIHDVKKLIPNQTSITFTVTVSDLPSPTPPIYIDGAQAEYGRIPSKYVGPTTGLSVPFKNMVPTSSGKIYYAAQEKNSNATQGNYSYNYELKSLRLNSTLNLVVPNGSSYTSKILGEADAYKDIPSSIVSASSFEKDLGGWVPNGNGTLKRNVVAGSLFGDTATQGQAYATAYYGGNGEFGLTSPKTYINPSGGYYASVAVRPKNSASLGIHRLYVDFYDAFDNEILVYMDNITGQATTNATDETGVANVEITDQVRLKNVTISRYDRWTYIANTFPVGTIRGAAYAKINITSYGGVTSSDGFDVDRVIFRQ